MKGNIVDPTRNIVDPHVRHFPEPQAPLAPQASPAPQAPQAPQAPTGLAAQPLTAAPHMPELPTAGAKTSWREWFATGDQRISVQERIALLERAPTRLEPAFDHGHGVQRFLLDEHDLELQSAYMRVQELESMIKRLSNPKPGHTTGESGQSARRSGRAGSGKIRCQQNYSPRKQKSTVLSKASKKRRFNVSPEARTVVCKGSL